MATVQKEAGLPLVTLASGSRIVVEAIDAATGAQVAGVVISGVAITYDPGPDMIGAEPPDVFLAHLPTG